MVSEVTAKICMPPSYPPAFAAWLAQRSPKVGDQGRAPRVIFLAPTAFPQSWGAGGCLRPGKITALDESKEIH